MSKKNDLIAKQQLEIESLKQQVLCHAESLSEVHTILYNMSGPLNCNAQEYTTNQLKPLFEIARTLDLT